MDPNKVLGEGRRALHDWEAADVNSPKEWMAAEKVTSAFGALDDALSEGGLQMLPYEWGGRNPLLTEREAVARVLGELDLDFWDLRGDLTADSVIQVVADKLVAGLKMLAATNQIVSGELVS